jgi:multiple sugar transport system substrate-binding protein
MKILLNLIVLVSFFYSFISCNRNNQNNNEPILYWCSNNNDEITFAKTITDNWNKNNPDQQVKYQPVPEGRSSEEIILAAVVGNTTPDIYSNMWQGDVEAYAQAGVLIALDTLKGFNEFLYERCDSSVIEEIKSLDGHIYQIPWKINPIMLIYNVNLINELELNGPPKTYSEVFTASKKFQKDFDEDGYVDRWFGYSEVEVTWWQRFFDFYPLYLAASSGAPLVKNDKAAFNNKYAIEVFAFLQEMYKKNYFSKEKLSARQDVFLAGVTATRFVGPWEIAHAEKFKPKGFEYAYDFMPVPDDHTGPVYTYGDPKNIVIFKTCKNPQAAWNYIKTMITNEGDLMLLSLTNQLPRRKKLNQDLFFNDYFTSNPKMRIFAEQSNYVRGTDASPVLKEIFDLISQEYEACVVYGMKTPEKAINDAADAVNLLFLK